MLMISISMIGQETETEKQYVKNVAEKYLKDLNTQFDTKQLEYNSKMSQLEDPTNLKNGFDLNKVRDEAITIQNELVEIVAKQKLAKKIYSDYTTPEELEKWFDNKKSEKFNEKILKSDNLPKGKLIYLNAVNFDFDNSKVGYVAHLNFYKPALKVGELGYNAGVLKVNYTTNDSTQVYKKDNVLINPLDNLVVGSKYVKQFNKYDIKTENSTYSVYFQPMFLFYKDYQKNKFYFHLHSELLISKYVTKTKINTIQSDTITINTIDEVPSTTALLLNKQVSSSSSIVSGYFGIGLTGDLNFSEDSSFFIQPTFGYTTDVPILNSRDDIYNSRYFAITDKRKWNGFYLVRSYFRQKLSEATELILGADVRGFLPTFTPLYSIYIGVNLKLEKLKELIK